MQATEYALVNRARPEDPITWLQGDVYAYTDFLDQTTTTTPSALARSVHLEAGEYVVLVKAMFEVRMFGDPGAGVPPEIKFRLVAAQDNLAGLAHEATLDVVADVVDGYYLGSVVGIGLRNGHQNQSISVDEIATEGEDLDVSLQPDAQLAAIAPGQTRVLGVCIRQNKAFARSRASLTLKIVSSGKDMLLRIPLNHRQHWTTDKSPAVFTHMSPTDSPTIGVLIPPAGGSAYGPDDTEPSILALHGAGVPVRSEEWTDSIPHRRTGWAILASGMTEWGLDWHGATMESAWSAAEAAFTIVESLSAFRQEDKRLPISRKIL